MITQHGRGRIRWWPGQTRGWVYFYAELDQWSWVGVQRLFVADGTLINFFGIGMFIGNEVWWRLGQRVGIIKKLLTGQAGKSTAPKTPRKLSKPPKSGKGMGGQGR